MLPLVSGVNFWFFSVNPALISPILPHPREKTLPCRTPFLTWNHSDSVPATLFPVQFYQQVHQVHRTSHVHVHNYVMTTTDCFFQSRNSGLGICNNGISPRREQAYNCSQYRPRPTASILPDLGLYIYPPLGQTPQNSPVCVVSASAVWIGFSTTHDCRQQKKMWSMNTLIPSNCPCSSHCHARHDRQDSLVESLGRCELGIRRTMKLMISEKDRPYMYLPCVLM